MSLKLDELTDDVILVILQYLAVRDILVCQLVCRRLNAIIQSSPILQFAICGFVEFCSPRTDITLQEKCDALRLHKSRLKDHTITGIDTFKMGTANGGFGSMNLPSMGGYASPLKDGVLAEWSLIHLNSHTDLQLDVVQLPSLNTGTGFKQWRLEQRGLNIRGSAIEPACDLLVLLEYTGPFVDPFLPTLDFETPRPMDRAQRNAGGLGGSEPQPFLFHFRTLSANKPHPSAFQATLDCELRTNDAWGFHLDCLGDLIIARPSKNHTEWECGLIIYNWVTGAMLDRRDESYQRDFVVLTNDIIVFPRSTFAYDSHDRPMGRLDLYRIDWSDLSGPSLIFAAILELPIVHSVPPPPILENATFMTLDAQGRMVEGPPPQPDLSRVAMVCSCVFNSSSHSGHPSAYTHGTPRIFTSAKSSQWLRVMFSLPANRSDFDFGWAGDSAQPNSTSLYVPLHIILDTVRAARDSPSIKRVQWDNWSSQARWIHLPFGFWEGSPSRAPAGTRCVLTSHSIPKGRDAAGYRFDPNVKHDLDVYLLDLDPEFTKEVARKASKDRPEGENVLGGELGTWIYQSATNNHMSPVTPYVDERRSWLTECGADKAVAPYAWCKFKHEYFDNVLAQIQRWKVYMDDEHIVVFECAPVTGDTVKIVAFTF